MPDWRIPSFEPHRDPSYDVKKLEQWRKEGSISKIEMNSSSTFSRILMFVCLIVLISTAILLIFCTDYCL